MNKNHPYDVGLSYLGHLKFAWGECFRLNCISFVMFVHGLVPWIWDWKYDEYLDEAKKRVEPQKTKREYFDRSQWDFKE